jgi:hypothetical protein
LHCLRDAAAAALRAYADAELAAGGSSAAGGGADVLVPLLCALLCAPGCVDVLSHCEFIDRFLLLSGAPPGGEDPRKSELGYLLISFGAAAEYVRHAGRTAQQLAPPAAAAKKPAAARTKPATHTRHASAPSMLLELVDLREPAAGAAGDAADVPSAAAVRPWLTTFGRWRLPVRAPPPAHDGEAPPALADTAAQ